ncbi:unnamed protein product [Moneuplotes crassus]|uniref:C2H2-type domain-containing protein n=1 Tax=Euplotes crassus TaxID=5936 RepID=A0AAD1U818_EUPCR|nr:unnamed protein product [Moneuplotes crassus]
MDDKYAGYWPGGEDKEASIFNGTQSQTESHKEATPESSEVNNSPPVPAQESSSEEIFEDNTQKDSDSDDIFGEETEQQDITNEPPQEESEEIKFQDSTPTTSPKPPSTPQNHPLHHHPPPTSPLSNPPKPLSQPKTPPLPSQKSPATKNSAKTSTPPAKIGPCPKKKLEQTENSTGVCTEETEKRKTVKKRAKKVKKVVKKRPRSQEKGVNRKFKKKVRREEVMVGGVELRGGKRWQNGEEIGPCVVKKETKEEIKVGIKKEGGDLQDDVKSNKPKDLIKEECLTGVFTNENTLSLINMAKSFGQKSCKQLETGEIQNETEKDENNRKDLIKRKKKALEKEFELKCHRYSIEIKPEYFIIQKVSIGKETKRIVTGYKCNIKENGVLCDKIKKSWPDLVDHVGFHLNITRYQCKICDKGFCDRSKLISHMQNHMFEKEEKKYFECPVCGKKYRVFRTLSNHYSGHCKNKDVENSDEMQHLPKTYSFRKLSEAYLDKISQINDLSKYGSFLFCDIMKCDAVSYILKESKESTLNHQTQVETSE